MGTRAESVAQDVRLALRGSVAAKGLTATCVMVLAVGIGLTTVVFSFINSALLRPPPYPDAERLVAITESDGRGQGPRYLASPATISAVRHRTRSFEAVAAYRETSKPVGTESGVNTLVVTEIDSVLLQLLRVSPHVGSGFSAKDHRDQIPLALVSERFWRRHFASANDVIGRSLLIGLTTYRVAGVMPGFFQFPTRSDLWIPLREPPPGMQLDRSEHFGLVAKLKPDIGRETARQEISSLGAQLLKEDASYFRRIRLELRDDVVVRFSRSWRPALTLFLAGASLVLLIACINVSTLMLMRTTQKQAAMATRAALGATPYRIMQQSLVETGLLLVISAGIALGLATWGIPIASDLANLKNMPSWFQLGVDFRVFAFVLLLTLLSILMVGISPAYASARVDLMRVLKSSDQSITSRATAHAGLRSVAVQLALAVVLASASFLLSTTYQRISRIDPGYARDSLVTLAVGFVDKRLSYQERFDRVHALAIRMKALSEVRDAAVRSVFAGFVGIDSLSDAEVFRGTEPRPLSDREWIRAQKFVISDGFFTTAGIPLERGANFRQAAFGREFHAVVSHSAASLIWGTDEVVGRTLRIGSNGPLLTVLGVVGDVRGAGMTEDGIDVVSAPSIYLSNTQALGTNHVLFVRATASPEILVDRVAREASRVIPGVPFAIQPPDIGASARLLLTAGTLFGICAVIAAFLSSVGIYSVIAFAIAQRSREIGIRLALGGSTERIRWEMMRQVLAYGVLGIFSGLLLSAVLAKYLRFAVWAASPFAPSLHLGVAFTFVVLMATAGRLATRVVTGAPLTRVLRQY